MKQPSNIANVQREQDHTTVAPPDSLRTITRSLTVASYKPVDLWPRRPWSDESCGYAACASRTVRDRITKHEFLVLVGAATG